MAYAEGQRPTKRFGVIVRVVRDNRFVIVPTVTAHDAEHAGTLAMARVLKTIETKRVAVWKVFRGTLQEAV